MTDLGSYKTLLLGIDGSDAGQRALEHALTLARDLSAKLYVLHIVDTPTSRGLNFVSLNLFSHSINDEVARHGTEAAAAAVARATDLGVEVEGLAGEGKPGEQICRAALERGADIIVLGATGKSNLEDVILGSVSEYVVDHSSCPVFLVGKNDRRARD